LEKKPGFVNTRPKKMTNATVYSLMGRLIVQSAVFLLLSSSSSLSSSSWLLLKRYENRVSTSVLFNLRPRLFFLLKSIDMTKRNFHAINLKICSGDDNQEVKREESLFSSSSSSSSSIFSLTRDTEFKYFKSKNHVSVFGVDEAGSHHIQL